MSLRGGGGGVQTNVSHSTKIGAGHRVNQDCWHVLTKGAVHSCVVCDGHGDHGEKVSRYVCPIVAREVLAFILDVGGFESSGATAAVQAALKHIDALVRRDVRQASRNSGCTVAGFVLDIRSGVGFMFSVGDSLVFMSSSSSSSSSETDDIVTVSTLDLQNANNAPSDLIDAADKYQWKTKIALIGTPEDSNSKYMMFPNRDEGLQLYSTMGDFDLKSVNPLVRITPQAMRVSIVPPSRFLVASDGYLDGTESFDEPLSDQWYDEILRELDASRGEARVLLGYAVDRKSTDDITVIIYDRTKEKS
jgi:serine/threonine protein phosphatase PrpC